MPQLRHNDKSISRIIRMYAPWIQDEGANRLGQNDQRRIIFHY